MRLADPCYVCGHGGAAHPTESGQCQTCGARARRGEAAAIRRGGATFREVAQRLGVCTERARRMARRGAG